MSYVAVLIVQKREPVKWSMPNIGEVLKQAHRMWNPGPVLFLKTKFIVQGLMFRVEKAKTAA